MLESTNPFNDPSIRNAILSKEGMISQQEDVVEEYETLDPEDQGTVDFQGLIASTPKIPKAAKNLILDAGALAKQERDEKAKELSAAINTVFSNYNKQYGTDLQINLDDLSKTLVNVSNPESRRVLELYVSETFKSIRPVLLLHVLQRLVVALDVALDPQRLLDTSQFSSADSIVLIEKLVGFIVQIQDMIKEIEIPDSDKILQKLADDKNEVDMNSEESKQVVDDFMKLFLKEQNK